MILYFNSMILIGIIIVMRLIDIDAISLGLYISGYLLWKFNLSAEIIFSPDFIRIILLILVLFLHVVYNFLLSPRRQQ